MMFIEKGRGQVEMPPKQAIHTNGDAFLHAMPAYIPKTKSAGLKWVGGYPDNHKHNLPYITGLLVLNDAETGVPYALMDCTWITAIRTAGVTALTAKHLAPSQTSTLAILGCGVQGRYNLACLNKYFRFEKVWVYDISDQIAGRYADEMGRRFDLDIEITANPRQTVANADIIVTVGPFLMNPQPEIPFDWIKPGALVCPLDLDSYLQPDVFTQSNLLFTDDLNQFNHFKSTGLFQSCPDDGVAELCDVVTGAIKGRVNDQQVITVINIGLALDDMAVAPLIYQRAMEKNCGVWLDL